MTTTAEAGEWVAPPQRAIWIPAGVAHANRHSVGTELRTDYVRSDAAFGLPARCAVVQVSPLLRELVLAVMRLPRLYDEGGAGCSSSSPNLCIGDLRRCSYRLN